MRGIQVKMARAALGWGVQDLATRTGIAATTLDRVENGIDVEQSTMDAIQAALEAAGIAFLDGDYSGSGGPGVRLARPLGSSVDTDEAETIQYREVFENDAPPGAGG